MSAQITIEQREIEIAVVYVGPLGLVVCTYCHHAAGKPAHRERMVMARPDPEYTVCDLCDRDLFTQSIEIVTGMATIEHTPCKIF